jgi:aryl-alcohol dehydrogenase-like predicted oxidoreductase
MPETIGKIGYGCGGFWGKEAFPEKKAQHLFELAVENGVTFFDTGPNYSDGNAEKRLGKFLDASNAKVVVGSKIGSTLNNKGKRIRDFSKKAVLESVSKSLENLRRDHLNILQLHGAPEHIYNEGIIETLTELKAQKLVKLIGVSADEQELETAIMHPIFDTIMTTFNLIEHQNYPIIKKAKEQGKIVFIKSPMAHNVFSNSLWKVTNLKQLWYLARVIKNYRHLLLRGRKYRHFDAIPNWNAALSSLRYTVENPYIDCAVIGTCNPKNLLSSLQSIKTPMHDELNDLINTISN